MAGIRVQSGVMVFDGEKASSSGPGSDSDKKPLQVLVVGDFAGAALEGLVEIARSPAAPGLPWITRAGEPEKIRAALERAFADPALTGPREALLLSGFSALDMRDYDRITGLEAEMEKDGGLLLI